MRRTQIYLDDDLWKLLHMLARQSGDGGGRAHIRRRAGRMPLRLATIAEPLLIKAVTSGVINPPGNASASATVLSPATIA